MALQISSGAGNTPVVAPLASASATPAAGTGTQAPPQYQLDFNGLTRSAAVGLANPTNLGDLEIMFSQIAAALKDKLGELEKMDSVTRAETLRGGRGLVLAAVSLMDGWGAEIDANNVNIRDKTEIYDKASKEKDAATTTRNSLAGAKTDRENWIKGAGDSIDASNTRIGNLNTDINKYEAEMRGLKLPAQQAKYNELSTLLHAPGTGLYAQRANENQNILTQRSNIEQWRREIGTLEGQLKPLNDQIEGLSKTMDGADNSRKESARRIDTLGRTMALFFSNVVSLMLGMNNATQGEAARDAGMITPEGDSFETLLANFAKAVLELGTALADNARGAEIINTQQGAGLSGTDSTPDRFGQMSAPVARAVAFAGLVGATMSALAEVLRNLAGGLAMQTAGELATAGQPRLRVGL